ncbi:hypothetical protein BC834DRAFT_111841 [Gloeopeniophorella convolvens]|nr:hypothetical protein BC834DRAFT_111841 [Gloeopeniophorella convolvens]
MSIEIDESNTQYNHVPANTTYPVSVARAVRSRRPAPPLFHPTTFCLFIAVASTRFIAFYKHSETTNHAAVLILSYCSLVFSLFGALSSALPAGRVVAVSGGQRALEARPDVSPEAVAAVQRSDGIAVHLRPRSSNSLSSFDKTLSYLPHYAFASLACFTAQVWLYIYLYEPRTVQVACCFFGTFAFAKVLLRRRAYARVVWISSFS